MLQHVFKVNYLCSNSNSCISSAPLTIRPMAHSVVSIRSRK